MKIQKIRPYLELQRKAALQKLDKVTKTLQRLPVSARYIAPLRKSRSVGVNGDAHANKHSVRKWFTRSFWLVARYYRDVPTIVPTKLKLHLSVPSAATFPRKIVPNLNSWGVFLNANKVAFFKRTLRKRKGEHMTMINKAFMCVYSSKLTFQTATGVSLIMISEVEPAPGLISRH